MTTPTVASFRTPPTATPPTRVRVEVRATLEQAEELRRALEQVGELLGR